MTTKTVFPDGAYYLGELQGGIKHGKGMMRWTQEYYYFGDWKNDKRNGKGVENNSSFVYEGGWLDNECHGRGAISYHLTDSTPDDLIVTYDGEWKHNKMCGRGFGVFADGSTYEGEFQDDNPHGYGIAVYPGGGRDEGCWVNGDLNGYCVSHFSPDDEDERESYMGEFKDNVMHGKGEMRWTDGVRVITQWVEGLKQGEAILYSPDGSTWTGQYVNDIREGPGRRVDVTFGYTFEGNYCDDERGDGAIRWLNGDSWVGRYFSEDLEEEISRNEWLSEGVLTFAETGNTLKGQWLDLSMKNGRGEMVMWIKEENREVRGEWIDGVFQPAGST